MENKILILQYNDSDYFSRQYKRADVEVKNILKDVTNFLKILRLINTKLKIPLLSIWYGNWKKELYKYNTVIVYDHPANVDLVKYIRKKNSKIRIIFWYWNSVSHSINPNLIDDKICEKWTFDHRDAVKYNMNENTQYYFDNDIIMSNDVKYKNDVIFVGLDKGRKEILDNCKKIFSEYNIKYEFIVPEEIKSKISFNKKYINYIPYEEVLQNIIKSKAILDIVNNEEQYGLSLRPLESIFLKRKLITTNDHINKCDFYNKDNIFILDKDDISNLSKFLSTPFVEIDKDIVEKYKFENWLKRFFKNKIR